MTSTHSLPLAPPRPTLTVVRGGAPTALPPHDPTSAVPGHGERRLLLAILEDAILIVQHDPRLLAPGKRRLQRETRDWFVADDPYWPFSFVNVCDALGFDATKLRSALSPFLDTPVPAPTTGPGDW
jgi:hypothetical protein